MARSPPKALLLATADLARLQREVAAAAQRELLPRTPALLLKTTLGHLDAHLLDGLAVLGTPTIAATHAPFTPPHTPNTSISPADSVHALGPRRH